MRWDRTFNLFNIFKRRINRPSHDKKLWTKLTASSTYFSLFAGLGWFVEIVTKKLSFLFFKFHKSYFLRWQSR